MIKRPGKGDLEASRQTVRFFETVMRSSSDGIIVTDRTQTIILANDAFCAFFGRSMNEVIETSLFVWLGQLVSDAPQIWSALERKVFVDEPFLDTEICGSIDGRDLYLSVNASSLEKVADEEQGAILSIWRDITRRKLAEKELERHRDHLEELIEERTSTIRRYEHMVSTTTDYMAYVNSDYTYMAVSNSYLTVLDKTREEIVGHKVAEILGDETFTRLTKPGFDRCLRGETVNYQAWFEFPGVGRCYVDVTYCPYREDNGPVSGIVVSSRDITPLYQTQEALVETTMMLDNILRSADDVAIATTDLDLRITYYNPKAEKLFGHTSAEVIGRTVMEVHTKDRIDPERFEWAIRIIRREGRYTFSITQDTEDGPRYIELRLTGIFNRERDMVGFSLFARDVTERKQAEKALLRSEERFRTIFENAPVLIGAFDEEGHCLLWNAQCHRTFGRTADEILTHDAPLTLLYPDPAVNDKVLRTFTGNPDGKFRKRYPVSKSGKELTVLWANYRLPDGLVLGMGHDITEQQRTEDEIKQIERYMTGLNNASALLLIPSEAVPFQSFLDRICSASNASRLYVFTNHQGTDGELLTSQMAECCADGIQTEIHNPLLQNLSYDERLPRWKDVLSQGGIIQGSVADFPEGERPILEPRGILAVLVIPIMVEEEFVGFIGSDNCVSDRKWDESEQAFLRTAASNLSHAVKSQRLKNELHRHTTHLEDLVEARSRELEKSQESLRRTERLTSIGALAAGVAHEINNPLGLILLAAEDALEKSHDREVTEESFSSIRDHVERCAHIVGSVLRFSREVPLERGNLDVNQVILRTMDLGREYCRIHRVELKFEPARETLEIVGNLTEMEQVLINLIHNAVQASRSGQTVLLRANRLSDQVEIRVQDRGRGMTEDEMIHAFDPFYSTRSDEGGTGLGLSVSYGIIRDMDGTIRIESELSKGTTFVLSFPHHGSKPPE